MRQLELERSQHRFGNDGLDHGTELNRRHGSIRCRIWFRRSRGKAAEARSFSRSAAWSPD